MQWSIPKNLFFANVYGKNNKSAAGDNFRNRSYFNTKKSTKTRKKFHKNPPEVGDRLNFEVPPVPGDSPKIPQQGGFTPSFKSLKLSALAFFC